MRLVAGRGAVAELLAEGAAAKSHREEVAGRGAVLRWCGRGAVEEVLLTEAPLQTGRGSRHEPQCL